MPEPETTNFRSNLAELCAEHGEVQRIALAAGISRVYLSRIIHGRSCPSLEVALKIARALGYKLEELTNHIIRKKKLPKAS